MKILWLVNIIMPELAEHFGKKPSVFGGWLTGAMHAVRDSGNELVICTTANDNIGCYDVNGVRYYVCKSGDVPSMQTAFKGILEAEKPDVVHLYGTEFEQSWAMASIADPERCLVSVQGLVSFYADHVCGGVPDTVARDTSLHKLLRKMNKGGQSIAIQKNSYLKRAETEIKTLERVRYVNGGTAWGDGCAKLIQPDVNLLQCGLILRSSYYDGRMWSLDDCEKHSIFTIYTYPIKGFDMFLHALKCVVERYPDTHAYVAGNKCAYRKYDGIKKKVMDTAPDYDWYVQGLIEKYGLKDNITFMGFLDEAAMHERELKSHVFVSASAIENHSTALGEAMICGVPSVASCVGGLQEMIDHEEDGFLYPFNETYMMAEYICRIFEDDALARQFSVKGHEHAARTYNREENCKKLLEMYETVDKNAREKEI